MKPLSRSSSFVTLFCMSLLFSLVIGCSDDPVGGISGTGKAGTVLNTGIIVGQIDSINELSIDGLIFDATASEVTINGEPGSLEDLRVGMAISAEVDYDQQTAKSIAYQPLVAGPVDSVSDDKRTVVVLGQKITISEETYLDDLTVEDIFEDNVIEVSGSRNKSSIVVAEYIRVPNLSDNYFVIGQLDESSDSMSSSFIAGTNVDLSSVLASRNNNSPTLPPQSTVKAELDSTQNPPNGTSLTATSAEVVPDLVLENLEQAVINGVVSTIYNGDQFLLKKFIVSVNTYTVFRDRNDNVIPGMPILENDKLKVTGVSAGDNTIVARIIKIKN